MRIVSYLGVVILIVSLSFYEFVLTTERGRGRSGNRGRGRGSKYTEKKMSSIPKPRPESSGKSNSAPKMQVSPQQESSAEYVDSPRHQQSRHAVTPVVLMRHPQHQQHPEQQEFDYLQQPQYSQPQYSQPQYSQPQYSQQHQYQLLSREQYHALQQHQALQDLLKCNGLSSQSNTIQKNGQPQIPNNGSGQRRGLNAPRVVPIQSSQGVISPTQTQRQASTTTPVMRKSIAESHPLFNVESATETVDTMTLKVNTETSTKSRKIEGPSTNVIGYDDLKKVRAQVPISVVQPGPVPQLRNFTTRERFLQDKDDLFDDSKENFITHPCELEEKPWLSPLYEATPLPELTRAQREVEDRFDNVLALQCQDLLVTEEEKRKKYIALTNIMNWLENYYSSFLLSYCPDKMVPPVKVLPYGSMRLGVELKGSDIDLVCFYPETAEFTHFVGYLRDQLVACSLVMPLQKIVYLEKALAPILSFYYDNIPVDISFCPLDPMMLFNDIDLVPDTHVFPLLDDVRLWRPLNGHRATELLRLIVPDFMIFQKVLVHVKGWAIQQGIYSNVLGYFSGMALAIMVAKICRKYPGSGVGVLTRQFFKFYASYDWSVPLTLGGPFYVPEFSQIFEAADYGGQSSMVVRMNPDHYHPDLYAQNTQKYAFSSPMKVMPLTFPYFPVTAYVTDSTLAVLQRELAKGHAKMEKLFQETKASVSSETTTLIHLPNIYVPSDFFTRYTRYVVVLLGYPDLNVLTKFSNFVESKARVSIFNYLQDRYKLIVPSSDSTNNNSGIRNGSISNPTTLLQLEPFGEKICFGYEAGANKDDWLKQFLDLYVIESESEKTAEKASEADEPPEIVGESSDFGSSIDTNKPSSNGESISSATNPTRTFYHCSVLIAGVTSRPTGRATGKAIKMMSAIEYSASLKDPQFYLQQEEEKQKRSFEGSGLNVEHLSKLCDEVNRGSVAPLIWDDIGDIFRSGGGFKSIFHEVLLLSVDKLPLALFTNSCRK